MLFASSQNFKLLLWEQEKSGRKKGESQYAYAYHIDDRLSTHVPPLAKSDGILKQVVSTFGYVRLLSSANSPGPGVALARLCRQTLKIFRCALKPSKVSA
jgi:hypothetical protein